MRVFATHLLRSPRVSTVIGPSVSQLTPYTPPPILSPLRSGSGLYCTINNINAQSETKEGQESTDGEGQSPCGSEAEERDMKMKIDDEDGSRPQRKNGFFYTTNEEMDIDALRKDSWASSSSAKSNPCLLDRKPSWFGLSSSLDDSLRKASSVSDCYYDCLATPQQSDANPHINIGRDFQARVKKWADREVLPEEKEAIPDRDEPVFDCTLIDHLDDEQLTAYEYLACSRAVPRPGRNKELALHLLMENKGNIEAAVMDLLRSDTLDWEQYPVVYNSIYNDSTPWTPEQIVSFQDALYKSEKDFHQVALETGLPVKVCIEWYYTWKKALPDDYRKLRNLRRKRKLLEEQMGLSQPRSVLMGQTVRRNMRVDEDDETIEEGSSELAQGILFGQHVNGFFNTNTVQVANDARGRLGSFSGNSMGESPVHKNSGGMFPQPSSPGEGGAKFQGGRVGSKKGAQPAADGFFHCRLCDKCFEKVKSLNAHMKSHAMKARAEAEARSQVPATNSTTVPSSLLTTSAPLSVEAQQLQQLGLATHLLGLNGMQGLTQSSHPLAGLQLTPSLGIH